MPQVLAQLAARFICFFKPRGNLTHLVYKTLDVEFLPPERQIGCGRIKSSKSVYLVYAGSSGLSHKIQIEIDMMF